MEELERLFEALGIELAPLPNDYNPERFAESIGRPEMSAVGYRYTSPPSDPGMRTQYTSPGYSG